VQLAADRFESGFNQELPLVVEVLPPLPGYTSSCEADLESWLANYTAGHDLAHRIELYVRNQSGDVRFIWSLSQYVPLSSAAGLAGRRFTFGHGMPPDLSLDLDRSEAFWGTERLFSAGERGFEIESVPVGFFPTVVEENPTGLTVEFGFLEGGGIWEWVRQTISGGSEFNKRNASVITVDAELREVSRMNYYDCFPKKYEQFAGFSQALQSRERVILQCSHREPG